MKIDENFIMPFGKYKGLILEQVPSSYLLWLHERKCSHKELRKWLKENLDGLNAMITNMTI